MSKNYGICPECDEAAWRKTPSMAPKGWLLGLPDQAGEWVHTDDTPLCPVMTSTGYEPARPI